jgi:hypothetical protein
LRVKRSDPWRRANASPKAMAVLVQTVQTRRDNRKRVCTWFASRWPQPPAQTSSEASLENSVSQDAGRPCYEAENSACRGEWRREAGSPARARQMPARERERGELPSPICPRLTERSGGDLCFQGKRFISCQEPKVPEAGNIQHSTCSVEIFLMGWVVQEHRKKLSPHPGPPIRWERGQAWTGFWKSLRRDLSRRGAGKYMTVSTALS